MNSKIIISILFILAVLASGCITGSITANCVRGSGDIISETRTVDDFHNFFIGGFKEEKTRKNRIKVVKTQNCGEQP